MHSNVPDTSRYVTQNCRRVVADVGIIREDAEDGEEEILDDEGLPEWAQRAAFIEDRIGTYFFLPLYPQFLISFYTSSIGRAHALLFFFLSPHLQPILTTSRPTSRTSFLTILSSGQLLCIAYNACVRKSKQP